MSAWILKISRLLGVLSKGRHCTGKEEKGWQRLGGGDGDGSSGASACVYVRRQCATPRGRPLDGDNAHPFPRLLYVFPPLLRILCRNKFFLRRIKILEEHSEYLCAPILMSLGGNKTAAGPLPLPVSLFFYRPVLASPFRNPLSPPPPLTVPPFSVLLATRKPRFEKKSANRRVQGPLAGTTLTFAPVKCYVPKLSRLYPSSLARQTFVQRDVPSLWQR